MSTNVTLRKREPLLFTDVVSIADNDPSYVRAVLVGDGGFRIRLPLLQLVAACPALALSGYQAVCCGCEDVVIHVPGVDEDVARLFVCFVSGQDVSGIKENLSPLCELCDAVGMRLSASSSIPCTRQSIPEQQIIKTEPVEEIGVEASLLNGTVVKEERVDNCTENQVPVYSLQHETVFPQTTVTCEICNLNFIGNEYLERHMSMHGEMQTFSCRLCRLHFSSKELLLQHLPTHNSESAFKCDVCYKTFSEKTLLTLHFRGHVEERQFACDICKKSYKKKADLRIHMKVHSDARPYMCETCGKDFKWKRSYMYHISIHTANKTFSCKFCDKIFDCKLSLKMHIVEHSESKPHKCEMCGASFKYKQELLSHVPEHSKDMPFHCNICYKGFTLHQTLVTHISVHSKTKPFKCSKCKKSFKHKTALAAHIRSCTGTTTKRKMSASRIFKCDVCGMSFRAQQSYIVHMYSHTEDRKYKCDICSRSFKQKSNLTLHKTIHSTDRPFKCKKCLKTFKQNLTLRLHMLKHHPKCQLCGETCESKSEFEGHICSGPKHECSSCSEYFNTDEDLAKHMHSHSKEPSKRELANCTENPTTDNSSETLPNSMVSSDNVDYTSKSPNENQDIAALKLDATYPTASNLKAQLQKHSGAPKDEHAFKCDTCKKSFKLKAVLASHMRIHCNSEQFLCNDCGKAFKYKAVMLMHVRTAHGHDALPQAAVLSQ